MDWILIAVFLLTGAYAVAGNCILAIILQSRRQIPFLLGGMAAAVYFRLPRDQRTRTLNRLALTVLLSLVLAVLTAAVLYPRVWASEGASPAKPGEAETSGHEGSPTD